MGRPTQMKSNQVLLLLLYRLCEYMGKMLKVLRAANMMAKYGWQPFGVTDLGPDMVRED
jgi:hypothetical protein